VAELPLILFDGICNFCNGTVNFLIKRDPEKKFRFAPLQSETGKKILEQHQLPADSFDSIIFVENGKLYKSSSAALKIMNRLSWQWKWSQAFWIVPRFLRDGVYNLIARNRYKWFGKKEQCMIPTAETRSRFLS
jgi:predicted DCC family thiol-disulfide oxidoreductase YuxK